jgi:hypothetical protein
LFSPSPLAVFIYSFCFAQKPGSIYNTCQNVDCPVSDHQEHTTVAAIKWSGGLHEYAASCAAGTAAPSRLPPICWINTGVDFARQCLQWSGQSGCQLRSPRNMNRNLIALQLREDHSVLLRHASRVSLLCTLPVSSEVVWLCVKYAYTFIYLYVGRMLYWKRHRLSDQNWLILALIYMSGTMTGNVFFWKLNAHLLNVKNHVTCIGDCSTRVQSEDNKLHLL